MVINLLDINPPDNTGSDTINRYFYQAHVSFPYFLCCAIQDNIESIYIEHFEDILVKYTDYWEMIQIKTKNEDLSNWTFLNSLDESGGLKGLARSYKSSKNFNVKYKLFLEGSISNGNDLNIFLPSNKEKIITVNMINKVVEKTDLSNSEAKDFLEKLTVISNTYSRDSIEAVNISMLRQNVNEDSYDKLSNKYNSLINEINKSMQGDRASRKFFELYGDIFEEKQKIPNDLLIKKFDKERILKHLGELIKEKKPLLIRFNEEELGTPTMLETKLLAAGITDEIIEEAKNLRANASIKKAEKISSSLYSQGLQFSNIESRLITLSKSKNQKYRENDNPGVMVWDEIMENIQQNCISLDIENLFDQEPFLILGYLCELSDQCKTHWGVDIA